MNELALHFGPAALAAAFTVPIALAIKALADARARTKLFGTGGSHELIRAVLTVEEENRRLGALRWGIVLSFIGAGLAFIAAVGWYDLYDLTPGVLAVLLVSTGLGNLAFFAVAHRLRARGQLDPRQADGP